MLRMAAQDQRKGSFDGRSHDVGAAAEFAAPQVDGLVHCAALLKRWLLWLAPLPALKNENIPAISSEDLWCETVRDPRSRNGSPFRRLMAKKERIDGREVFVQRAAFNGEAAFE